MRFTIPFFLAIAAFTATVLGANQTSFNPNEDMLYDIVSASDAIAFRLEHGLALPYKAALILGAMILTIPALLTFHVFRMGFGGSLHGIREVEVEQRREVRIAEARHEVTARERAAQTPKPRSGEVLSNVPTGERARTVGSGAGARQPREKQPGKARELGRDLLQRMRKRKAAPDTVTASAAAPSAAAASAAGAASGAASSGNGNGSTSGTTSLFKGGGDDGGEGQTAPSDLLGESPDAARGRNPIGALLDKRPNLDSLKSSASGLRDKIRSTTNLGSRIPGSGKDSGN